MRLRSDIWVKAYLRVCENGGAQAIVVRHGDDDAGAIYIKISRLDGTAALFGPAPAGLEEVSEERRWTALAAERLSDADADARLRREVEFDADIWIVEVEDRQGRHFLDDWLTR